MSPMKNQSRTMLSRSSGRGVVTIGVTSEEARALLAARERFGGVSSTGAFIRSILRDFMEARCPDLISAEMFYVRKWKLGHVWPNFHEDVLAWTKGTPLSSFLREGLSRNALYVRFRVYAREQGWITASDSPRRDTETRDVIARWLATDLPTRRNRDIGNLYLKTATAVDAAIAAGVSRQRVSQVIRAARRDLLMAEKVSEFPRKKDRIDFFAWADGAVWRLVEGVDFHCDRETAVQQARAYANTNRYSCKMQRDMGDARVLYVQLMRRTTLKTAFATSPEAPPASLVGPVGVKVP